MTPMSIVRIAGYSATCGKRGWSNPPNERIGIAPAHVAFHKRVGAPDCIFSELNTQPALRG